MQLHSFPCGNSELFTEDKEARGRVGELKGACSSTTGSPNYFLSTYHWSHDVSLWFLDNTIFSYCIISKWVPWSVLHK